MIATCGIDVGSTSCEDRPAQVNSRTKASIDWNVTGRRLHETLAALAEKQGKDARQYLGYRGVGRFPDSDGYARRVTGVGKAYIVAVQPLKPVTAPGISAQQLVLLTTAGEILDLLRCEINSRYGLTNTEFPPRNHADGSQIVIRFEGHRHDGCPSQWHNWHRIEHNTKAYTFRDPDGTEPNAWDREGLCRITICDGAFHVVFPRLPGEKEAPGNVKRGE
jgi:hypothetical protein